MSTSCDSGDGGSHTSGLAGLSALSMAPRDSLPGGVTATASTAGAFALDELLADFVGSWDGGAAALVMRDGTRMTAAAGVANAGGDPVTPDTLFRVGSISKSFVATMTLQLVDEGRVDLDEPLATYLADTTIGGEVTIRALLSHRSGLVSYTDIATVFLDALADRSRQFTPEDVLGYVDQIPPGEPDDHFAYSNTNYILLGQLIERLDGTDLNTALRTRITGPLGLSATRFATGADPTPDGLAAGWSPGINSGAPDADYASIVSSAWAAGALVSTVGELSTFLSALFAGTLISEDSLAEMTTTGSEGAGLGLFAVHFGADGSGYGHSGEIFGYHATMGIEAGTGDMVVVATNNDGLVADELAAEIIDNW